jgi:hypothetical protein
VVLMTLLGLARGLPFRGPRKQTIVW